jgi:hypothetical protein
MQIGHAITLAGGYSVYKGVYATGAALILIGSLTVVSGFTSIVPRFPGSSRPTYGVPIHPLMSLLLSFHGTVGVLLSLLVFIILCAPSSVTARKAGADRSLLVGAYFVSLAVVARFGATDGIIRLWKIVVAPHFAIVVCRRFSSAAAHFTRASVMPIFGAYGVLAVVDDDTLHESEPDIAGDTADELGRPMDAVICSTATWQVEVRRLFAAADLVAFDWSAPPTET